MLPRNVSTHTARIRLQQVAVAELLLMEKEIEAEVVKLADEDVDVIGFGCTSGSLVKGLGHDEEIVKRISEVAKKPAVATAGAVVEALKSLRLSRIAVATPYTQEINESERKFLEQSGFSIVKMSGLGLRDNLEIGRLEQRTVFNLAKDVDSRKAQGIFISCTNMPTIEVITRLEKTLKKPVISSNTSTLWAMLKKIGLSMQTEKYGKLFLLPRA